MAVKYAVHVCDVCGGEGHVELANSPTVPPAEWISIRALSSVEGQEGGVLVGLRCCSRRRRPLDPCV